MKIRQIVFILSLIIGIASCIFLSPYRIQTVDNPSSLWNNNKIALEEIKKVKFHPLENGNVLYSLYGSILSSNEENTSKVNLDLTEKVYDSLTNGFINIGYSKFKEPHYRGKELQKYQTWLEKNQNSSTGSKKKTDSPNVDQDWNQGIDIQEHSLKSWNGNQSRDIENHELGGRYETPKINDISCQYFSTVADDKNKIKVKKCLISTNKGLIYTDFKSAIEKEVAPVVYLSKFQPFERFKEPNSELNSKNKNMGLEYKKFEPTEIEFIESGNFYLVSYPVLNQICRVPTNANLNFHACIDFTTEVNEDADIKMFTTVDNYQYLFAVDQTAFRNPGQESTKGEILKIDLLTMKVVGKSIWRDLPEDQQQREDSSIVALLALTYTYQHPTNEKSTYLPLILVQSNSFRVFNWGNEDLRQIGKQHSIQDNVISAACVPYSKFVFTLSEKIIIYEFNLVNGEISLKEVTSLGADSQSIFEKIIAYNTSNNFKSQLILNKEDWPQELLSLRYDKKVGNILLETRNYKSNNKLFISKNLYTLITNFDKNQKFFTKFSSFLESDKVSARAHQNVKAPEDFYDSKYDILQYVNPVCQSQFTLNLGRTPEDNFRSANPIYPTNCICKKDHLLETTAYYSKFFKLRRNTRILSFKKRNLQDGNTEFKSKSPICSPARDIYVNPSPLYSKIYRGNSKLSSYKRAKENEMVETLVNRFEEENGKNRSETSSENGKTLKGLLTKFLSNKRITWYENLDNLQVSGEQFKPDDFLKKLKKTLDESHNTVFWKLMRWIFDIFLLSVVIYFLLKYKGRIFPKMGKTNNLFNSRDWWNGYPSSTSTSHSSHSPRKISKNKMRRRKKKKFQKLGNQHDTTMMTEDSIADGPVFNETLENQYETPTDEELFQSKDIGNGESDDYEEEEKEHEDFEGSGEIDESGDAHNSFEI